jgi:lauroyl/myristoyl acyltransferase
MFRLFYYLSARARSSTGNTPVRKDRAMRQMLRSLKRNEILGILIDQNVAWQVVKTHAEEGATN